MPFSLQELVAELVDTYDDGRTTAPLLERVRELLEPGRNAPRDDSRPSSGKGAAAPLPVGRPAFSLVTDLDATARQLELELRQALGLPARPRGGSSTNTRAALEAVVDLAAGLDGEHEAVREVWAALYRWRRRARQLTGHERITTPLRGHVCPYCELATLRLLDERVVCIAPRCADAEGRRYSWAPSEQELLGALLAS